MKVYRDLERREIPDCNYNHIIRVECDDAILDSKVRICNLINKSQMIQSVRIQKIILRNNLISFLISIKDR